MTLAPKRTDFFFVQRCEQEIAGSEICQRASADLVNRNRRSVMRQALLPKPGRSVASPADRLEARRRLSSKSTCTQDVGVVAYLDPLEDVRLLWSESTIWHRTAFADDSGTCSGWCLLSRSNAVSEPTLNGPRMSAKWLDFCSAPCITRRGRGRERSGVR